VPDSIVHITNAGTKGIEFQNSGASPIFALGVSEGEGHVAWADYCQIPIRPRQLAKVEGRAIGAVVTAKGVYGDENAVDAIYRRFAAAAGEWHSGRIWRSPM